MSAHRLRLWNYITTYPFGRKNQHYFKSVTTSCAFPVIRQAIERIDCYAADAEKKWSKYPLRNNDREVTFFDKHYLLQGNGVTLRNIDGWWYIIRKIFDSTICGISHPVLRGISTPRVVEGPISPEVFPIKVRKLKPSILPGSSGHSSADCKDKQQSLRAHAEAFVDFPLQQIDTGLSLQHRLGVTRSLRLQRRCWDIDGIMLTIETDSDGRYTAKLSMRTDVKLPLEDAGSFEKLVACALRQERELRRFISKHNWLHAQVSYNKELDAFDAAETVSSWRLKSSSA